MDKDQVEKPLIRVGDKPWPGRSLDTGDSTTTHKEGKHPEHQAKKYVGQPLSLHQDIPSSGTQHKYTQGGEHTEKIKDSIKTQCLMVQGRFQEARHQKHPQPCQHNIN